MDDNTTVAPKIHKGSYLNLLKFVHPIPDNVLNDENLWSGMRIDYHLPVIERIWMPWGEDSRIMFHKIYPCPLDQALYHPHPWPSGVRILRGEYLSDLGYGTGLEPPPVIATVKFLEGMEYEMIDPNGWHNVAPIAAPSFSIMVIGKPWNREMVKVDKKPEVLTNRQKVELLDDFRVLIKYDQM